jgi:hypothetical protein
MENEKEEQHLPHISNRHRADKYAPQVANQVDKIREKKDAHKPSKAPEGAKEKKPAGGFDSTPIPQAPPGYTLKFTFHRAKDLPFADINSLSSDPFIHATLTTDLQKRHKQDPDVTFRTPTIRRNTSPEWNCEWIVAHVPASGFFLKCRIYDEDPADHDDRLGNVHVHANGIGGQWSGMQEQPFKIKKRMGSKRAYLFRGCAALISRNIHMSGEVFISVQNLGRSEGEGGRVYTIGPHHWSKHYSPLIGRLAGTKAPMPTDGGGKKAQRYKYTQRGINQDSMANIFSASNPTKYNSVVQCLRRCIIAMSSLNPLWQECSLPIPSRDEYSTMLSITNTQESINTTALQSTGYPLRPPKI